MEISELNFILNTGSPKPLVDSSPLGAYSAMGRKRPGHCGRCKLHGIKVPLTGSNHRFLCPFLRCACVRCLRIEQDAARRRARHPRLAEQVRNIVANFTTSTQHEQNAQTPTSDLLEPRTNETLSLSSESPTSEHMSHCGLPAVAPASLSSMGGRGERLPARASNSNSNSNSTSNCKNAEVSESMSVPKSPLERRETSSADLLAAAYLHSYAQWMTVLSALYPPALCFPFAFPTPSLARTPANECTSKRNHKQSEAASLPNDQTIRTRFEENGRPFISFSTKVAARAPARRSPSPSLETAQEEWEDCGGLTIHTTPFVSS